MGELNQQKKRRREKNSSCAVPRTCKQRKHAVCLRAADGRSSRSRVPEPSSDSFPSLSACLSCLQSGPNAMLSAKTMELVSMPLVRLGQIQTLMEHPACLSQEASVSPFCIVRLKKLMLRGPAPTSCPIPLPTQLVILVTKRTGLALVTPSKSCRAPR